MTSQVPDRLFRESTDRTSADEHASLANSEPGDNERFEVIGTHCGLLAPSAEHGMSAYSWRSGELLFPETLMQKT